jgi:hypothetical protein
MGWLFINGSDKKELVVSLNKNRTTATTKIIASRLVGNHHWYVAERADGKRFIGLDLIQVSNGRIGYKDMDESMGPFYHDCPLSFLKMAPHDPEFSGQHSAEWRERVVAHHARKDVKKKFVENMVVMYGGMHYTLYKKIGYSWEVVDTYGKHWKLTPRSLNRCTVV